MWMFLQVQPPGSVDDTTLAPWVLGALVIVVGAIWGLYQKAVADNKKTVLELREETEKRMAVIEKSADDRLSDRDKIIESLQADLVAERQTVTTLRDEREFFFNDIRAVMELLNQNTSNVAEGLGGVADNMSEMKAVFIKLLQKWEK